MLRNRVWKSRRKARLFIICHDKKSFEDIGEEYVVGKFLSVVRLREMQEVKLHANPI